MEDKGEQRENRGRSLVPEEERALREYPRTPEVVRAYPVEEEADLRKYLDVIRRRKGIILAFFVVVVVTTLIGSFLARPIYKATATVEISLENPRIVKFDEVVEVETRPAEFYETQYKLLKSKSLAKQVIDKLDLAEHPEFAPREEGEPGIASALTGLITGIKDVIRTFRRNPVNDEVPVEISKETGLVNEFLGRVEISPVRDSRLVDISFEAYERGLSAKTINTLADTFIEWNLNRRLEATKEGRDFLKKQLQQTQANLERSEEELNAFAKRNDIISLDEKMNLTYHQFSELNDVLAKAENERLAKESLHKHVLNGNVEVIPVVVNDPYLQELKTEYAKLKAEYGQLSAIFKPEYPKVKQQGAKVAEIRGKIDEGISSIVSSIKSDYEAALKREEILRERYEKQKGLASALNEKAVQYNILDREVQTNKSIYESLLQRLKETEVSAGIKASSTQVVDYASVPLFPYKPKITLNVLLAAVVGLFAGVFIAFFMEYFDNTLKSTEEIRDRLRFPVLGGIFKVNQGKELGFPIEKAFLSAPRSHFAEAFRTIRASLLLSTPGAHPRSILITSPHPGEGKTTVSVNLAISFAQAGSRVLLLEADFRRPRIEQILNTNGVGLTDFLTGNARLEEAIKEGEVPKLFVLNVGSLPVNPAELIGSDEMRKLLEKLREEYDYIIVDGPPALGFADALIISSILDGTVVVASANETPRGSLTEVMEKLWGFNARVLGVVLNRVEYGRENYYYKKYYHYYNTVDKMGERKRINFKGSDRAGKDDEMPPTTMES